MPQPNTRDVHTNAILTNISVAFIQNQAHFIANKVFPIVPVDKQSDLFYTFTKADWFRDEAKRRGDATESAGSGYGLSTDSYSCDVFALHKDIGDQARKNSDAPLNPDRDATQFVTQRQLLRQEIQWATDFFASGVWTTDNTPSNLWSNHTASTPISDVETAKRTILINTGYLPNTMVLGYDVKIQLIQHPEIVDRIKYAGEKVVTDALLAQLFGVERIFTAMAIKNTAVENETASYSFTHGKHALVCYSAPTPSLLQPSAGYTFVWRGVSNGLGQDIGISRFRMEHLKADRVEAEVAWDNKKVAADLGYLFASVVA